MSSPLLIVHPNSWQPHPHIRLATVRPHKIRNQSQRNSLLSIRLTSWPLILIVASPFSSIARLDNPHVRLKHHWLPRNTLQCREHRRVLINNRLKLRIVRNTNCSQIGYVRVINGLGAINERPAGNGNAATIGEIKRVWEDALGGEGEGDSDLRGRRGF